MGQLGKNVELEKGSEWDSKDDESCGTASISRPTKQARSLHSTKEMVKGREG